MPAFDLEHRNALFEHRHELMPECFLHVGRLPVVDQSFELGGELGDQVFRLVAGRNDHARLARSRKQTIVRLPEFRTEPRNISFRSCVLRPKAHQVTGEQRNRGYDSRNSEKVYQGLT